ncbi:MAG TPA: hypothetical protein VEK15_09880, partial [Vicinamibacteria bacterium]|nr:hypothetical protein [Vicinamibacteria bacterium]
QETSSIGDVAVAPSDPDILWVGTGEPNNRQSSTFGRGVYRSLDGGATFSSMGLSDTHHIGKVLVHPTDPSRVYVAALGALWSQSEERGVYRTTNGGGSWERVLFVDRDTGAVTLAMDPVNPDVLYAATYQRRRVPWGFDGGGPGSGIYRSTDGGENWQKLTEGIPAGPLGRIGIAVSRADPGVVYALIEHAEESGLYRSADRGGSFERINEINPRPMYYSKVILDPNDGERIYVLGSSFHVSDDGGETFTENEEMTPTYDVGVHGDHHALLVDPADSNHLVLGGDGGLYFSWDRGRSWDKINNIPLTQFYAIAVDLDEPYNIYGGAQDTHSWAGPSTTRNHVGILNQDWFQTNFGDGMYQQADPNDATVLYTESQGGNLQRVDRRTGDRKSIRPYPSEDQDEYRFHWTSPLRISRHDPGVLFFGGNRLFISRDRGDSWMASPDLTWNEDRDELPIMGAEPNDRTLSRHDGVSDWGTVTTIAESPLDPRLLYVGTDDGRIQQTRDGGETWRSLEANLAPFDSKRTTVSRIVASHSEASRAYVSLDRHQLGDFAPYLFVTEDGGDSWRSIVSDLPERGWINVVVEHPRNGDLLFVGTETGLFVSFDRGGEWMRMTGNFPTVPVDDIVIHPRDNDLVVGTHGRSIYILDDITPLEHHRPRSDSIELFDIRKATLFLPWKHESYLGQRPFIGPNAPFGALITYRLPSDVSETPLIRIKNQAGVELRTLPGTARAGFNRIVWDLRVRAPELVGDSGPLAPPGGYSVALEVSGERRESSVQVVLDPRLEIPEPELQGRFEFLTEVNALRARLAQAVSKAKELEEELDRVSAVLRGDERADIRTSIEEGLEKLTASSEPLGGGSSSFRNPSLAAQATRLYRELEGNQAQQGTLHGPTEVQRERLRRLTQEAEQKLAEHEAVVTSLVSELNERLREVGPLRIQG